MNAILSRDRIQELITADFEDVVALLARLNAPERRATLDVAARHFSDHAYIRNDARRIATVRILVGLLPDGNRLLERLLEPAVHHVDYEIQFTLFCYLHWACRLPELRRVVDPVLSLTRSYMIGARSAQASAVWMAGDMLGAHWEVGPAGTTLSDVLQNARKPVGRLAALDGIEQILRRLEPPHSVRAQVRAAAANDKSRRVREYADSLLDRT
jgi:hypothetical protein